MGRSGSGLGSRVENLRLGARAVAQQVYGGHPVGGTLTELLLPDEQGIHRSIMNSIANDEPGIYQVNIPNLETISGILTMWGRSASQG